MGRFSPLAFTRPDTPWTTLGKAEADSEKARTDGNQSNPEVLEDILSSFNETWLRWQTVQ